MHLRSRVERHFKLECMRHVALHEQGLVARFYLERVLRRCRLSKTYGVECTSHASWNLKLIIRCAIQELINVLVGNSSCLPDTAFKMARRPLPFFPSTAMSGRTCMFGLSMSSSSDTPELASVRSSLSSPSLPLESANVEHNELWI